MIAVARIGVLSALAIPNFVTDQAKARRAPGTLPRDSPLFDQVAGNLLNDDF